MGDSMKPDTQKAQKIVLKAFRRIALECGLRHDWATFTIVALSAASGAVAEVIRSDDLMKDGGETQIKHMVAQFESMLREDIAKRMEHDRKQTRQ